MKPPKQVYLGPAWTPEDLQELTDALKAMAEEGHEEDALELLNHGYAITSMTGEQYDQIELMITKIGKGSV